MTKPMPTHLKRQPGRITKVPSQCSERCLGGNKCVCVAGIAHVLHVCRNPECYCHSRESYDRVLAKAPNKLSVKDEVAP